MKRIIVVFSLICSLVAVAQNNCAEQKLSGYLQGLIQDSSVSRIKGKEVKGNYVCALMKLELGYDVNSISQDYGCNLLDSIGIIYIVNIPVNQLMNMSMDVRIKRIETHEAPHPIMHQVPASVSADRVWQGEGLPQAFTGKGVIAGVIDADMDFTHPMFLDSVGGTRVRRFIDMTKDAAGNIKNNVYDSEEIMKLKHCPEVGDELMHGTHVASIMAGSPVNGMNARYSGIAPESDLVFECQESETSIQLGNKETTTASFLLAFKHIFDYADECHQPCVINASWGVNYSPMDPCILENEALEELTGPGRIIVAGAGNDGNALTVMEKSADNHEVTARFDTSSFPIILFLMTDNPQAIKIRATVDPSFHKGELYLHTDTLDLLNGKKCTLNTDSLIIIDAFKIKGVSTCGYKNVYGLVIDINNYIDYYGSVAWRMTGRVSLISDNEGLLYAYPYVCRFRDDDQEYLNSKYTLLWPAEAESVIAVGSYNDRSDYSWDVIGDRSGFSSQGPTWDGRIKPDVLAPGNNICAAGNSYFQKISSISRDSIQGLDGIWYGIIEESGTSMASPVVSGAVALWLQAKPDLSPTDIKDLLERTCRHPIDTISYPNVKYGFGFMDVYAGLLDILGIDGISEISHHQPLSYRFALQGKLLSVLDASTSTLAEDVVGISIYSTTGVMVSSRKGNTIDLSCLPSGVYAVQVNSVHKEKSGSTLIRL